MRSYVLTLVFVLSIIPLAFSQTIIFQDDFESYVTGTHPTANWVTRFNGHSAQVSETVAHSGIKSFKLVSNPFWSRVEVHELAAFPDYFAYEGWVYINQSGKGYCIGPGKKTAANMYSTYNDVRFRNDGKISFRSVELQTWTPRTWYKVKVCCDFINLKGKVWIDDVLKAQNVDLVSRDNFSEFSLRGNNWTGSGTSTAYFDDIKLLTYIPCEAEVNVSIPDTTEAGDQIVDIPVYVSDVTNQGIYSFGMTVATDPNILIPKGAVTTGTLSDPWGNATFNINGGIIKVAIAGSTPLAGSGTLIYLRYQVPAGVANNATTPITINDFIFNDGQPGVIRHNGSFTVLWKFDVSGNIKYYNNDIPLPVVDVSLDGHQTQTGNSGDFQFLDILYGNYTLRPEKTGGSAHAVAPYDAALILLSNVKLITLTPYQKIAADVTGNKDVSGLDASFVLRYYVGLIPEFPVKKDWTFVPTSFPIDDSNWSTAPDSIRYEPLNSDKTNQDFVGIVYGDVSGNWQLPTVTPEHWLAQSNLQPNLSVGTLQQDKDGHYALPIVVTDVSDLFAMGLTCQYDQNQIQFVAAELKATTSQQPMLFYNDCNGTIKLGIATAHPINGNMATIRLHFKPTASIQKIQSSSFSIPEFSINGKLYQVNAQRIETKLATALPQQYELSQNFPNPFNAETLIKYQLPQAGYIAINIYNLLGQKIRTMVAEEKEAGFYQFTWDGRDDWNEVVGSGEYLCQMRAGDFVAVRKVVLIR